MNIDKKIKPNLEFNFYNFFLIKERIFLFFDFKKIFMVKNFLFFWVN